ncbi:malonyl-ACP O-methyltransferase BioC [Moraxella bovoculi]|uniref:malonyl-ACP O-methyltransferase BioC n=1 Tax=Moraxella bovoculi TaxID=386891 RepID=UPI000624A5DE|nr:malonyl-ACP O-methyltransferase BioC [Moraxella bovoculi]AKG16452.1 malonyl-[acyl-carrier protein] O-methyltransferase BioC [Moraxella bovoculi]NSM11629.1 malonyl-ACP O-methyltransferase BioC [Moraxella bovoculi]
MLNADISTEFIAHNFKKAHATYDQSALVQHQMCQHLITLIQTRLPDASPKSILEIGCGVGNLTKLYHPLWQIDELYLNDLYDVHSAIDRAKLIIGDIEHIDLPRVDMALSSSALQWVKDLPTLCHRIHHALSDASTFAFATFGQDNLHEMKTLTGIGLDYHSLDDIIQMLSEAGFDVIHTEQTPYTLYFDQPKQILRHIKETGVSVGSVGWTKSSLAQFYENYRKKFAIFNDGKWRYPLTYDAIYVVAVKR